MKLIQVNKYNEKYYSQDFIDGFNLGAKTQYEKDKEALAVKQMPKKPKEDGWLFCPTCGRDILMDRFSFCPDCGTAIDWSDVE